MADPKTEERTPLAYLVIDRLTQPQFLLAIGSGVLLWWLTGQLLSESDMPQQDKSLIAALVGFISGQMVGPGWQFYFGNTKASDDKTKALADNAATQRVIAATTGTLVPAGGIPASPTPVPVLVKNPYADKTDDELRQLLVDRSEDPTNRTREEMLAKLAELDAAIPTEPRA